MARFLHRVFPVVIVLQFEKAATAGVVVVVVLCAIIVTRAVQLGFPAVASGELDVLAVKVRRGVGRVGAGQ